MDGIFTAHYIGIPTFSGIRHDSPSSSPPARAAVWSPPCPPRDPARRHSPSTRRLPCRHCPELDRLRERTSARAVEHPFSAAGSQWTATSCPAHCTHASRGSAPETPQVHTPPLFRFPFAV